MRSITLLRILLLLALACSTDLHARENYIRYHLDILSCEKALIDGHDPSGALTAYKKAIDAYRKPFLKDCFIALQAAAMYNDSAAVAWFFRAAVSRGLEWTALEEAKHTAALLRSHPALSRQLQTSYKPLRAQYLKGINHALRAEIISMKHHDDSVKMRMMGKSRAEAERLRAEYGLVLDSQTLRLAALTRRHGFLGDNLIGLMNYPLDGGEEQRRHYCLSLRSLVDQLYFHHGCCYFLTAPQVERALQSGEIAPGMYATIYDWAYVHAQEGRPEMRLCSGGIPAQSKTYRYGRFLVKPGQGIDTAFVNTCRAAIGLGSLEHIVRKTAWAKAQGVVMQFGMFGCY